MTSATLRLRLTALLAAIGLAAGLATAVLPSAAQDIDAQQAPPDAAEAPPDVQQPPPDAQQAPPDAQQAPPDPAEAPPDAAEAPPEPAIAPPDADISPPAAGNEKPVHGGPMQMEGVIAGMSALPGLDLSLLSATRDRPLFRPDRRPLPPPPPVDAAPPPVDTKVVEEQPFDYELKGIIGNGANSIAILNQPGVPTPLRAKAGDVLNGWTLTRIEDRALVVTGPSGEERRLTMFEQSGGWTTDEKGLRHLTIGPDAGAAPPGAEAPPSDPGAPDASMNPPPPDAGMQQEPPPPEQPPQDYPAQEAEPKDVRKVY